MNHSHPLPHVHPLATAESTHPLALTSSDFTPARRSLYRPCTNGCYTLRV